MKLPTNAGFTSIDLLEHLVFRESCNINRMHTLIIVHKEGHVCQIIKTQAKEEYDENHTQKDDIEPNVTKSKKHLPLPRIRISIFLILVI